MPIQVLLADDHQIMRQGLKSLLEREGFRVVAEAADGREALRLAETSHPDVVILDLAMPGLNGVDAAKEIARSSPKTKAILLTMHKEDAYVLQALSPGVSRAVVDAYRAKTDLPPDPLSPREREVLQLVAEGKTTKEVAAILGVSVKTAESHRTRIMEKLDIHETAGLVRYAIRRGVIQP